MDWEERIELRPDVLAGKPGELAFRWGLPAASGIILLRARGSRESRTAAAARGPSRRVTMAAGQFAVVENDRVRMTPLRQRE